MSFSFSFLKNYCISVRERRGLYFFFLVFSSSDFCLSFFSFIYLFWAVLGLRCFSLVVENRGPSPVAVTGFSLQGLLVEGHRLQGVRAQ